MKASWKLFVGLSIFYAILAVIYWQVGGEAVGITAITLSAGLAGLVGFYMWLLQSESVVFYRKIMTSVRSQILRGS